MEQQDKKIQQQRTLEKKCNYCGHIFECMRSDVLGIEDIQFVRCPECYHAIHVSERELKEIK